MKRTEQSSPAYEFLDAWPLEQSLEALVAGNERAVAAAQGALPQLTRAAAGIEARLEAGGRLLYAGAGTSGRLALQDAAELLPTFGFDRTQVLLAGGGEAARASREGAEDDAAAAAAAVLHHGVGPADALIGIAASGTTPFTVAAVRKARARGAFTVGIANNPDTPLLKVAEVGVLLDTGPEVLAGSTRLAAGTAQKIALNALSTAILVRLGGAYQNYMVGMRPSNDKLRQRAADIVAEATGSTEAEARTALEGARWRIREAIVMLAAGLELAAAQELLAANGGRVRAALVAARGLPKES